jgi:hypothetical protein
VEETGVPGENHWLVNKTDRHVITENIVESGIKHHQIIEY